MITLLLLLMIQPAVHIKAAEASWRDGLAAMDKKTPAAAIGPFQRAISIEPTFGEAYQGLIEALLATNQRLEAAAAMTRFLEIEPEHNEYRLMLGKMLSEGHDLTRALAQFSLVLRSDPGNAEALLGFANAAGQLGMRDRAAQAMEVGRRKHPGDKRFQ